MLCIHHTHIKLWIWNSTKNSGYHRTKLIFSKKEQKKQKQICNRNIIWFNPPFSRNVTANIAKRFLNLLYIHFPKSNKLQKIFNKNTIKVSYCCSENLSSVIKTHNKKLTNEKITPRKQCNYKNRNNGPFDGNCQTSDIIYKCIASTTNNPDKIYPGTAEGNFKESITTRHHSNTEKRQMTPPSWNMYGN